MINAGFIPSTNNIVELYQFKRSQIDRYLLKQKIFTYLEATGVTKKITLKEYKDLLNTLAPYGSTIKDTHQIVAAGSNTQKGKGDNLPHSKMLSMLDNTISKKLGPDDIVLMENRAVELIERYINPRSIYEGPSDFFKMWRETNNILQNVQLGFGYFHVGTMLSESMGSSLDSFAAGTAAVATRLARKEKIKFPRALGDEELPPIESSALVEGSLLAGRFLKFGLPGLAVVRDTAANEGYQRSFLRLFGRKEGAVGNKKTTYPAIRSMPLQILATVFTPLKRNSSLVKKAQEFTAKLDPDVSPEELFTGVPVENPSKYLNLSGGAIFDYIINGTMPMHQVDPVVKSIVQQMILSNMQFPSMTRGRKYQIKMAKTGHQISNHMMARLERGEDIFGWGVVPDTASVKRFKEQSDKVVNWGAWMFEDMIPQAKLMGALERLRYALIDLGPDATPFQIRKATQEINDSIENRFGQVHYPNLFWDQQEREYMHLLVRSVGWNMGTLREVIFGGPLDALKYGALKTVRGVEMAAGIPKNQRGVPRACGK